MNEMDRAVRVAAENAERKESNRLREWLEGMPMCGHECIGLQPFQELLEAKIRETREERTRRHEQRICKSVVQIANTMPFG